MEYLRIGTKYYRIIESASPKEDGKLEFIPKLVPWKISTIKQDHGNEFLKENISKFITKDDLPQEIKTMYEKLYPRRRF